MPANYVLLEKITVGSGGASSVTFSGIPQTGYTDLVVRCSTRNTGGGVANYHNISFNGSSSSFTGRYIEGSGSAASSGTSQSAGLDDGGGATASTFANTEYYVPNYTSANYKSYSVDSVTETNGSAAYMSLVAGLWSNTAAITSVGITPQSGNLAQYSTFYLYGVAKLGTTPAIVPYATGGDTIMTDGTYWYHAFKSSGTFTPQKSLTCDYLVVAGGGGGGYGYGGGGGAGGLRSTVTATGGGGSLESPLSLGTSAYTVTIGAGGAPATIGATTGTNGSNSVFSTITSTGGGGGASAFAINGAAGGSGGGGTAYSTTGGARTTGQGFAGGTGGAPSNEGGGGGGGAGAVGATGAYNPVTGTGGNGVAVSISGSSVTYAGGGGGGGGVNPGAAGGTGGGGTANGTGTTNNGTANLGGGGGGNTGTGGSGIVIVRYAV